ncbi:MAG TPA: ankyrin repeat domain-containing protein [Burkholderiaceae bacterium]|nr:ankyrin repeat domain-containing protein [Burkholderiaceae bacterium]
MLIKHINRFVYCLVASAFFSVSAGSFDDFFTAIRQDDASALLSLLQRGFDPNTRDESGQPGLTIAMQVHAEKAAKLLLQHPAIDVDALNSAGESALMIAALKGDIAGTKLLLASGAHVNQPGWSALHYAATGPKPEIVQLLLERGATVDARSPNGTTPLMMAARYGSADSVKQLLERGADPKLANQRDLRAADFARLAGRESLGGRLDAAAR